MPIGTVFCNQCRAQNSSASQFCSNCGAPLANALAVPDATVSTPPQAQYLQAGSAAQSAVGAPKGYGGFWIRFVAAVIDGIIVQAVVMPVAFILGLILTLAPIENGPSIVVISIGGGFGLFASWLYEAAMESSSRQATLGKMVLGMKVTDLQGNRISFARATARHFSKYLSALILLLGYIMAGFTERKQALHDMIAGTVVRRG